MGNGLLTRHLRDPDTVGELEHRALYELLRDIEASATDADGPDEIFSIALASLANMKDWANALISTINAARWQQRRP